MPAGRPTDYDPSYCEVVIECGKQGFSRAEMASHLDTSRQTMAAWEAVHPEFLTALQRAKDESLSWWEMKARAGLDQGSAFNAAIWAKSMNGRFPAEPYRDRQEISGPNGGAIQTDTNLRLDTAGLSEDQLLAIASVKVRD